MGTRALPVVQLLVKRKVSWSRSACLVGTTSRSICTNPHAGRVHIIMGLGPSPRAHHITGALLFAEREIKSMDRHRRKQQKTSRFGSQEVSSIEWEYITMTEQEEDLIYRMYRLVGDRWSLIAGRIPGRTAQEIERFWIMRHNQEFAYKRKHCHGG